MTQKADQPADDHNDDSLREADDKMLLRDKEDVERSHTADSPPDDEHDPEALSEADRKMLLRDDRT